jgi:hypothetical protein
MAPRLSNSEPMTKRLRSFALEFVVVVTGVVVALAADSAMDRVRQGDERFAALEALHRDIAEDLAQLDSVRLPFLAQREAAREALREVAFGDRPLVDSVGIVVSIYLLGSYRTFDASTAAIDYLTDTGNLQLIENAPLRSAILTYYNGVEDVADLDALYRADAITSVSRWSGELVGGEASALSRDVDWQREAPVTLRVAAAKALDAAVLRGEGGLPRFLDERHPSLIAQAATLPRLRRQAEAVLELLDHELNGG